MGGWHRVPVASAARWSLRFAKKNLISRTKLLHLRKHDVKVRLPAGVEDVQAQSTSIGSRLQILGRGDVDRIGRVYQKWKEGSPRVHLMQQLESLGPNWRTL